MRGSGTDPRTQLRRGTRTRGQLPPNVQNIHSRMTAPIGTNTASKPNHAQQPHINHTRPTSQHHTPQSPHHTSDEVHTNRGVRTPIPPEAGGLAHSGSVLVPDKKTRAPD